MDMIYTMGAFSDCMPVNFNLEQQVEEVPEFTVTHLDDNITGEEEIIE